MMTDARRVGGVGVGEEAPVLERDLQRFEIAGRDVELIRRDDRFARLRRVAFRNDDAAAPIPAERQVSCVTPGRLRSRAARGLAPARAPRRIAAPHRPDSAGPTRPTRPVSTFAGDEARIDARAGAESWRAGARADDEHEGERDLRDDQRAADVSRRPAGGAGAPFLAQHAAQVHAGELQRRPCADDDAEKHRGRQRHRQHHASMRISCARGRSVKPIHSMRVEAGVAEQQAKRCAGDRSAPSLR